MNFTASEMWILGGAAALIFTLIAFVVKILLNQQSTGMGAITLELSGLRKELKEELKGVNTMLQFHDTQIIVMKKESEHYEEKLDNTDYIVSDLKKEHRELHSIVLKFISK